MHSSHIILGFGLLEFWYSTEGLDQENDRKLVLTIEVY